MATSPRHEIGRRVRRLRLEQGLSQEKLGEKASLATNWISAVERGAASPSIDTIAKLADALGVTMGDIICGDELALRKDVDELLRDVPPALRVSMLKIIRETVIHLRTAVRVELGAKLTTRRA